MGMKELLRKYSVHICIGWLSVTLVMVLLTIILNPVPHPPREYPLKEVPPVFTLILITVSLFYAIYLMFRYDAKPLCVPIISAGILILA
ncbi:MAG: hypothetical protein DRJ47_10920, partial [Thermoprotei archaeon]